MPDDVSPSAHLVDPELVAGSVRPRAPFTDETLPRLREQMDVALGLLADATPCPGQPIEERELYVPALSSAPNVRIKIFRPQRRGRLPAYLHMHGGGYVLGTSRFFDVQSRALADEANCVVVDVDYRPAPETRAPGAVEDCYAALAWIHDNADSLDVDPARIAIGGESAGAGLAAALALLARDRGALSICFQSLTYPMLDDRTVTRQDVNRYVGHHGWSREDNRYGWSALLGAAPGSAGISPYAAAARATDLSDLPPTYLMVGALDLFLEETIDYGRRLLSAGVPTELHVYPGCFHGFEAFLPGAQVSQAANRDRLTALRRALHGDRSANDR